jgi:hypothetical protein
MRNQGLFDPDILIAGVWNDAQRRAAALSSEKRLMLAVLHDAFDCYQKYMFAEDRVGRELFKEVAAWIECTSTAGLFSFESISEALDIDPEYFRRGLAAWHTRHLEARRNGASAPAAVPAAGVRDGAPSPSVVAPGYGARARLPERGNSGR